MQYDIESHPDLQDSAWIRGANRRVKREIRRQRRQARLRRHSGKIVAAVALVAVGAVLVGLHRAWTFADVSLPKAPDVQLPHSGVNVEEPFTGTPAEKWSDGIKVSGTMTLGEKDGRQTVTADYVFAYAFEPPDPKKLFDQMEMIAAVREKITYAVTPEGLWPTEALGHRYSIACRASAEGFLGPQFIEPPKQVGGPLEDDEKHFTVGGEVPTEDTCD